MFEEVDPIWTDADEASAYFKAIPLILLFAYYR